MSKIVACAQGIDRRLALLARGCRLGDPEACARLKAEGVPPEYAANACELIECPGFPDNPDAAKDCLALYAALRPSIAPGPSPSPASSSSAPLVVLGALGVAAAVGLYLLRRRRR